MSTNKTQNYQLNQWVKSDRVLMEDFNADNAKIDAALAGKASTSALNSVQSTLNSKITGLQSTVTNQGTALALRNCRFVTGSYTGTGNFGEANPNTLTFPYRPMFVCITGGGTKTTLNLIRGNSGLVVEQGSGVTRLSVSWSERAVSWYAPDSVGIYNGPDCQMNAKTNYYYFAILEIA